MHYKVVAKRFGNSVEFGLDASNTKAALQSAVAEAKDVFSYKEGEAGPPTVTVKPDPLSDDEDR